MKISIYCKNAYFWYDPDHSQNVHSKIGILVISGIDVYHDAGGATQYESENDEGVVYDARNTKIP